MKRGQAALEFLMTYGWAILVVLAAIAALAYFGVFNLKNLSPEACQLTAGFECKTLVTPSGVQFRIHNGGGNDLTNFTLGVTGAAGSGVTCTPTTVGSFLDNSDVQTTVNCTSGLTSGQKVKLNVQLGYIETNGFPRSKTGSITATVE